MHRHQWDAGATAYTPSTLTDIEAARMTFELLERLAFGVSTVTQRCTKCGLLRSYTSVGEVTLPATAGAS